MDRKQILKMLEPSNIDERVIPFVINEIYHKIRSDHYDGDEQKVLQSILDDKFFMKKALKRVVVDILVEIGGYTQINHNGLGKGVRRVSVGDKMVLFNPIKKWVSVSDKIYPIKLVDEHKDMMTLCEEMIMSCCTTADTHIEWREFPAYSEEYSDCMSLDVKITMKHSTTDIYFMIVENKLHSYFYAKERYVDRSFTSYHNMIWFSSHDSILNVATVLGYSII